MTAIIAMTISVGLPFGCQGQVVAKTNEAGPRVPVIYNLDLSEFFVGTFGPVVPETIDKFVDAHAADGVTDLFINVSGQRTNYRSDVWESYWDGYDPNLGVDQPFFDGIEPRRRAGPDADDTRFYINTYLLYKMGCDYPKRMIDRARKNHVRPWISLRMNDSHNPESQDHPIHSTFWKKHPEWRLSNGALDYERPEVRELQMKLIKEVCSRYDFDGLELDYQRFWLYFRPGREHEGAKLMTAFVEETRAVTNAAAKRWKHPVKLAVRVPTTPWIARRHGLDAVAWGKSGLVDMIIASPFWMSLCSDIPIETWKGLLIGTNVSVAFSQEDGINSGASGRRTATPEEVRGLLVSGLQRGADAVYFFNLFTNPYQSWPAQGLRPVAQGFGLIRGALRRAQAARDYHYPPVGSRRAWQGRVSAVRRHKRRFSHPHRPQAVARAERAGGAGDRGLRPAAGRAPQQRRVAVLGP